jgi:hypothetical protein
MKKSIMIMAVLFASLAAADTTGTYSGVGGSQSAKYGVVPQNMQLALVQNGTSVTGSLRMANATKSLTIASGTVSGTQVTFAAGGGTAPQITGNLIINGTTLSGTITTSTGLVYNVVFTMTQ